MVTWAHMSPRPNGISIGSAVFAQLTLVSNIQQTDTQKKRVRSLSIGRIYMRCTQCDLKVKRRRGGAVASCNSKIIASVIL